LFDLLELDGKDFRPLTLGERKGKTHGAIICLRTRWRLKGIYRSAAERCSPSKTRCCSMA
jgi:hypothetical protein